MYHAMRKVPTHVILSEAKNLWQSAILEGGWQILRFAQNDMAESLFHDVSLRRTFHAFI